MIKIFISSFFLLIVTGCNNNRDAANVVFNNETWEIWTNTSFDMASVEKVSNNDRYLFKGKNNNNFRALLKSLGPIEVISAIDMSDAFCQYRIKLLAGSMYVEIPLQINNGRVIFCINQVWYKGGESKKVIEAINKGELETIKTKTVA